MGMAKEKIRDKMDKVREMKRMRQELTNAFQHPEDNSAINRDAMSLRDRVQRVKNKGQQAVKDIRNGNDEPYENYWEHDPLPARFNKRRKTK